MPREWKLVFVLSLLILTTILIALFSVTNDDRLRIVACDVGQGDALLIQQKNTQILVDGGRGNSVLDCLSRYVPFWDRNIELVVLTHPDADHYEGLISVIERYNVKSFLSTEAINDSHGYRVLKEVMGVRRINQISSMPSNDVRIGLLYLDILYPDRIVNNNEERNNNSIVFNLHYENFSMLFTGDIGPEVSTSIVKKGIVDIDILKVPHHGSKNGLTKELLEASNPEVAVISLGKNSYGHPHKEILDMLNEGGVRILRTDEIGDIVLTTDGEEVWH